MNNAGEGEEWQNPFSILPYRSKIYFLDYKKIPILLAHTCTHLGYPQATLGIAFAGLVKMRRFNAQYRSKDYATDVLSFPASEEFSQLPLKQRPRFQSRTPKLHVGPPFYLGDLLICPPVLERNAKKLNQSLSMECAFLLVHGILHLLGHDHHSPAEAKTMYRVQRQLMQSFATSPGRTLYQGILKRTKRKIS